MITDHLAELVERALRAAQNAGSVAKVTPKRIDFERPKRPEHGDWSTNLALTLGAGKPRDVATALVEKMPTSKWVDSVELAGPGFINFRLADEWLHEVVRRASDPASGFGRSDIGGGQRVNVEYVSANPTGPVNVVSGRHAAVGDTIANLFEATGHVVSRENYVNDTGRQIALFGASVAAHYLRALGVDSEVPEDGYKGAYVADLGREIAEEHKDEFLDVEDLERIAAIGAISVEKMIEQMAASLERFGTKHDLWFRETSLHEDCSIEWAISDLKERGLVEEREDALWFLSSQFGDDKDRVIVRSTGESTYLAADVAYMINKFERGFEHLIYILGADHHGTVPRFLAVAQALGFERERLEIPIVQIVHLQRGGEALKASKREGVLVPLDELVDEVGKDAARYIFLNRSFDAPVDFDIELAKQEAPENPVYYVQYAHARICSILRRAADEGHTSVVGSAPLSLLQHDSELALMRKLASYEEVIPQAAKARAPQKITRFVEELAAAFSAFYRDCRVMSDDRELTTARLALCKATKSVVADGLTLLGVDAPERM